jgi:phage terminase small subunit
MAKMTAKQQRFCDEYLIDLNATQAAIRAGYKERYAHTNANKLLQNTTIIEYIQKKQQDREQRTEITQDMVLRELAIIAFSNAADYAKVIEKELTQEIGGSEIPVLDAEGKPVTYKTVEPILTDDLTEDQKKALAVIKKGRDGFEVKPYDKLRALEMLGRHLGMWDKKSEKDIEEQIARIEKTKAETARIKGEDPDGETADDGFIEALRNGAESVWQE